MHFGCSCGQRIHDNADCLPYKAYLLPDQDEGSYCDELEQIIRNESLSLDERVDRAVISLQVRYLSRCIYQCPNCGKLFVDDRDESCRQLHVFLPEGEQDAADKQLLSSSRLPD